MTIGKGSAISVDEFREILYKQKQEINKVLCFQYEDTGEQSIVRKVWLLNGRLTLELEVGFFDDEYCQEKGMTIKSLRRKSYYWDSIDENGNDIELRLITSELRELLTEEIRLINRHGIVYN